MLNAPFKIWIGGLVLIITTLRTDGLEPLAAENELHTGKEYSNAFAMPPDDPQLPNVLLIGDSISIGYTVGVRKALKGKADVFRISTNGKYTAYGCENLDDWLGTMKWDVIHFNWGLWDICYRNPEADTQGFRDKINGKLTTTPAEYQENLEKIVIRLKQTGARLIWCTTTPVPDFELGRKVGDEIRYNRIAGQVMDENGIMTDDLYAYALLKLPEIQKNKGDVHFTEQGYAYLAKKVASEIDAALSQNRKTKMLPAAD